MRLSSPGWSHQVSAQFQQLWCLRPSETPQRSFHTQKHSSLNWGAPFTPATSGSRPEFVHGSGGLQAYFKDIGSSFSPSSVYIAIRTHFHSDRILGLPTWTGNLLYFQFTAITGRQLSITLPNVSRNTKTHPLMSNDMNSSPHTGCCCYPSQHITMPTQRHITRPTTSESATRSASTAVLRTQVAPAALKLAINLVDYLPVKNAMMNTTTIFNARALQVKSTDCGLTRTDRGDSIISPWLTTFKF